MTDLFRRQVFTGFGHCALDAPGHRRLTHSVRARHGRRLKRVVRKHAPRLPGIYGMVDANGDLIYVGKAKSLRARLMSYFRPGNRDEKAGKIVKETRRLLWEVAPCEFSALLRELELIRRFQPRFNVQGQPHRQRRCYVCVGRRPAAHAFVSVKPPAKNAVCFGPVAGLTRAREAVRRLNDWYRLRDCPQQQRMVFADQNELFPVLHTPGCLRHDIGHCLAPCAAACTRNDYAFHVDAALDFLQGRDRTPLEQLECEMAEAAAAAEFERAAVLRDRLASLTWLDRQLERLRQAVTHSFVYPVTSHDGGERWYLVRDGLVRAVIPAPCEGTCDEARGRLAAVFQPSVVGAPTVDEVDGVLLVDGWFRRHRQEHQRVLTLEAARCRIDSLAAGVASAAAVAVP